MMDSVEIDSLPLSTLIESSVSSLAAFSLVEETQDERIWSSMMDKQLRKAPSSLSFRSASLQSRQDELHTQVAISVGPRSNSSLSEYETLCSATPHRDFVSLESHLDYLESIEVQKVLSEISQFPKAFIYERETITDRPSSAVSQQLVDELLATEETYVSELNSLIQLYVHPFKGDPAVDADVFSSFFANIEVIYELHRDKILPALQRACAPSSSPSADPAAAEAAPGSELLPPAANIDLEDNIGRAFFDMSLSLVVYEPYLSSLDRILHNVKRCAAPPSSEPLKLWFKNPKVWTHRRLMRRIMRKAAAHSSHSQINLGAYLLLPLQRLTRYNMFLERLVRSTDSKILLQQKGGLGLVRGYARIRGLVQALNEIKRSSESVLKAQQVCTSLSLPKKQDERSLIKELKNKTSVPDLKAADISASSHASRPRESFVILKEGTLWLDRIVRFKSRPKYNTELSMSSTSVSSGVVEKIKIIGTRVRVMLFTDGTLVCCHNSQSKGRLKVVWTTKLTSQYRPFDNGNCSVSIVSCTEMLSIEVPRPSTPDSGLPRQHPKPKDRRLSGHFRALEPIPEDVSVAPDIRLKIALAAKAAYLSGSKEELEEWQVDLIKLLRIMSTNPR
ncbi:rho guanine nucleotide exchange factor [Polychytrium aggregatum]|uniref:rho guanine nucleotide exchange factor n=1 Tax=Polychytrium aggregatum TaxID=110093 RepID=UPI0022FDC08C|nr:rho guanine nucleotide exchange factor [Polychytrium aggregatum]KAI9207495.1 Dbl homology domain-containing protein [Polychytrium aggregatum]